MLVNIPCGDIESFKVGVACVLEKYGDAISDYVKKEYLNGSPLSLGGHCSKVFGEMTSTQGMESRGKEDKKAHTEVLSQYSNPNEESRNPIHMLAAFARDLTFHSKLSAPLEKFATKTKPLRPRAKDKFHEKACKELRLLSDYTPPEIVKPGSGKVQVVSNLKSPWLYSIVLSEGKEVAHQDVLGKKDVSIEFIMPSDSRTYTSLKMLLKKNLAMVAGAPIELPYDEDDLKDIAKLSGYLTTLPIRDRKALREELVRKQTLDTPERQPGEDPVAYLYRRAQRDADCNAYIDMCNKMDEKESDSNSKGKGAKSKTSKGKRKSNTKDKTFEEITEAELALDKDAGEMEDDVEIPTKSCNTFSSEFEQIDGEGGALQAVLNDSDVSEKAEDVYGERRCDRVIMKKELGDWRRTKYNADDGSITCNCKRFSYHGDCPHCVYIEVLHLEQYPSGKANEQWQNRRKKMIHNLKVQCGKLRPKDTASSTVEI